MIWIVIPNGGRRGDGGTRGISTRSLIKSNEFYHQIVVCSTPFWKGVKSCNRVAIETGGLTQDKFFFSAVVLHPTIMRAILWILCCHSLWVASFDRLLSHSHHRWLMQSSECFGFFPHLDQWGCFRPRDPSPDHRPPRSSRTMIPSFLFLCCRCLTLELFT